MPYLLIQSADLEKTFEIKKKIILVGTDPGLDVVVKSKKPGILFSISNEGESFQVRAEGIALKLNSEALKSKKQLQSLDRLEWEGGVAVFYESQFRALKQGSSEATANETLSILKNSIESFNTSDHLEISLKNLLSALTLFSGADRGQLMLERFDQSGFDFVSVQEEEQASHIKLERKEVFSSSLLNEIFHHQKKVQIESIIGNPLADAASIIEARLFSCLGLPLKIKDKVVGALLLFTRSPGKKIEFKKSDEISLLATQAALLISSRFAVAKALSRNKELESQLQSDQTRLIFDRKKSPFIQIEQRMKKLASSEINLLVLGETGTGKELVSQELHRLSSRAKQPFVAINCAAIPVTLIESTLFGHVKGAFTGATTDQLGKIQQAHKGTLFLDEIGDLPFELQAKLLRVLQEKKVQAIGAKKEESVDIRIIAATHQNIEKLIRDAKFRQDLYFRLNGAVIQLPSLRERREDIPLLADFFIAQSNTQKKFTAGALEKLISHVWTGNVRELQQTVSRAIALSLGDQMDEKDLELDTQFFPIDEEDFFWEKYENLDQAQKAFTLTYVEKWLKHFSGNRRLVAQKIGISERTLYRLLSEES